MTRLPLLLAALLLCLGACLGADDVVPPTLCGNTNQSSYCDFNHYLDLFGGLTTSGDCRKYCNKTAAGAQFASFYTDSTQTFAGEVAKKCVCYSACDSLSTSDKEASTNFKLDACPVDGPDVAPARKCGGQLHFAICDYGNGISGSASRQITNEACQAHCNDTSAFPTAKFSSFLPYYLGAGDTCLCFTGCNSLNTVAEPSYNTNLKNCSDASTTGDPHLVGAHGTHFDFNGDLGKSYCLLSDTSLHINALLGGGKHDNTKKKKTLSWMRELGLFWLDSGKKAHVAVLTSRRGTDPARGNTGFISSLTVDGATQTLPLKAGETVTGSGGFKLVLVSNDITLKGGVQSDKYMLELDGVFKAEITVNPEIEANRCAEDPEVHFNLKVKDVQVSPTIRGILGQTFRPGVEREARAAQYKLLSKLLGTPVVADGESGAGFLDGSTLDYETSTVKQTDCSFAQGPRA